MPISNGVSMCPGHVFSWIGKFRYGNVGLYMDITILCILIQRLATKVFLGIVYMTSFMMHLPQYAIRRRNASRCAVFNINVEDSFFVMPHFSGRTASSIT